MTKRDLVGKIADVTQLHQEEVMTVVQKTLDYAMAAGIAALSHPKTINPNMSVSLLEDILETYRI